MRELQPSGGPAVQRSSGPAVEGSEAPAVQRRQGTAGEEPPSRLSLSSRENSPLDRWTAGPLDLDVHAVSRPARTFTGDFYFTHRRGDRLWFAHGDVAGKGLQAAIVMAMLQEEIERRITRCAETRCDPAATTQRLHEFLLPLLPSNRFVTAVVGHLADDGTLTVSNAGHCPPLVLRASGGVETIGSTGPVLGMLPGSAWRSTSVRLAAGDALVLYSDGVAEAEVGGNELGVEGVIERVRRGGTSSEIVGSVLEGLETSDDATVVVFRV